MTTRSIDTIMASGLRPQATGRTHGNLTIPQNAVKELLPNGGRPRMNHDQAHTINSKWPEGSVRCVAALRPESG